MEKVKDILHIHKSDKSTPSSKGTQGTSERFGTGSGTGVGTGSGRSNVPGGVAAPGGAGTGANVPTQGGSQGGKVVGVGSGSDYASAKQAATAAARQQDDVAFNTQTGTAAGRPVGGGTGSHTSSGNTSGGTRSGGQTTGVGTGSDYASAKEAAREAGRQKDDVSINTQSGTATGRPVGGNVTGSQSRSTTTGAGDVIDRKYYTGNEERHQDQAVIEKYREHNPYEKEYETTVQHTGRERQTGSHVESLGTEERVIGQDNLTSTPHAHIDRTVPTGSVNERPGGPGWVETKPGPICDSKTFTVAGDRTVDKERVTNLREHRDFEKEFEVATRLKGEHATATGQQAELLNRDHVIVDEKSKNACAGHPNV